MTRRTKELEQAAMNRAKRPYDRYEHHDAWTVLHDAVSALVRNGDLEVSTTRHHIVGFLCKCLAEAGLSTNIKRPPRSTASTPPPKPKSKVPPANRRRRKTW